MRITIGIVVLAMSGLFQPLLAAPPKAVTPAPCTMGAKGCAPSVAERAAQSKATAPTKTDALAVSAASTPACSILGTWQASLGRSIIFKNDGTGSYSLPTFCSAPIHITFFPGGGTYQVNGQWPGGEQCVSFTAQWNINSACTAASVPFQNADGSSGVDSFTRASGPVTTPPSGFDDDATGADDSIPLDGSSCSLFGCARWSVAPMTVSLGLQDIPLSYRPPVGPAIAVHLSYSHRDVQQPATFDYGNFGRQWTTNWLSYVTDQTTTFGTARLYQRGGGAEVYGFGSASTLTSQPAAYSQALLLKRTDAGGATTGFVRQLKDGSSEEFMRPAAGTRFFLTAIADPRGNRIALNYDSQLRLVSLTDAVGQVTTVAYENADPLKITKFTDPFGRTATFTYNAAGQLASITDMLGLTSSFVYGAGNFVNALTTPYGTTTFNFADRSTNPSLGTTRILTATDPLGNTSRVEFNQAAPGIAAIEPVTPAGMSTSNTQLDQRNTFIWNPVQYRLATASGGLDYTKARIIHWLRNSDGVSVSRVRESIREPLENRVWYDYPGQQNSMSVGSTSMPTHSGRVLDDGTTQLQTFEYNDRGNRSRIVDPLGRQISLIYDASGLDVLTAANTTGGGNLVLGTYAYNSQHRPLILTDAAGQTTQVTYNANGKPLSVTDALNQTSTYSYDGLGRVTTILNANGIVQERFTYDAVSRVASRTDSEGRTLNYSYDDADRITEIRYPDGTATRYAYARLDLASTTDRLGRTTRYSYDANRRLTSVVDPRGATTRMGYYEDGSLQTLTDPKGNLTRWDIDAQGRRTAKRYADNRTEAYAYERAISRLKTVTDALGQVRQNTFAPDNQLLRIDYLNALSATSPVTFVYDPVFGRRIAMTDGNGTTQYSYGAVGSIGALRLSDEDGPYANDTIRYQYDRLGRLTTRTVDATSESFTYDLLGRLATHSDPLGAFAMSYLGQTGQLTAYQAGGAGTQWTFDTNSNDRRLKSIAHGNSAARSFELATTPEDRILASIERVGTTQTQRWDYTYDDTDRLIGARPFSGVQHSYQYDDADNIASMLNSAGSQTLTYNGVNQPTSVNGAPILHDANGNLLDDGARTYRWDAANRLIGIGYKAAPSQSTSFRYDGLGRRVAIVNTTGTSNNETRYLWCGGSLCQARSATDTVMRRYYSEGEQIPAGNTQLFYSVDQLGSVRDVLSAQNGSKVASYDYDPYGNTIASSGRVNTDFRYAGMFFHPQSGLYLATRRAYDPRAGRWLSRDPLGESGGFNLYGYVEGSPIGRLDPEGELWWLAVPAAIAAIHWTRNYWNDTPTYEEALSSWTLLSPNQSIYHTQGPGNEGNQKFVSPSGHSEAVFNGQCLVTDPTNVGTFNFAGPDFLWGVPHFLLDVLPYYPLGNSPSDMFSLDRFRTTWDYYFPAQAK